MNGDELDLAGELVAARPPIDPKTTGPASKLEFGLPKFTLLNRLRNSERN